MMLKKTIHIFMIALICFAAPISKGQADTRPLAIDLSQRDIGINSDFSGTEVTLFGMQKEKGELAIVVTGPIKNTTLRETSAVLGLWIGTKSVTFKNIPSFYAVASTTNLSSIASPEALNEYGIGLDHLTLTPDTRNEDEAYIKRSQDALIQTKQLQGLYTLRTKNIEYITDELFKVTLWFPSNITVGDYKIGAYAFQDGALIGQDSQILNIKQVGLNADLRNFAAERSWLYSFLTIFAALLSGWLATVLLRRD